MPGFKSTLETAHASEEVDEVVHLDIEFLERRDGSGVVDNVAYGCANAGCTRRNDLCFGLECDSDLHGGQCRQ
jgi:hypothetical protein